MKVTSSSSYFFGTTEETDSDNNASVSFNGVTNAGEIVPDGQYSWKVVFTDLAGNVWQSTGTLAVDNNAPVLGDYANLTSPKSPYPLDTVTVTIPVVEGNPGTGLLYYRAPGESWTIVTMNLITLDSTHYNFTGTIVGRDVTTIYWKVVVNDTTGSTLVVDNNGQLYSYGRGVYEYVKVAGATAPTLYDDWTWTYVFTSGIDHVEKVWLRTIYGDNLPASSGIDDLVLSPDPDNPNQYSTTITHSLVHDRVLYKFMFSTDIGQEFVVEERELRKPTITLEEEFDPPATLDLDRVGSLNVSFVVPNYAEYVDHVVITYTLDDGNGTRQVNVTASSGGVFSYTFGNFSRSVTKLEYTAVAVDVYGNEIPLGKTRLVTILPELPGWEMSAGEQVLVAVVSLLVGVASGVAYSLLVARKVSPPRHALREAERAKEAGDPAKVGASGSRGGLGGMDPAALKRRVTLLGLALAGFAGAVISGLVAYFSLAEPEAAMLLFTGAFLLSVFMWVLLNDWAVERTLRGGESHMKYRVVVLGVGILIFLNLLAIFLAGNTVAWWRVRVNQQSYDLAGFQVPKALTTVATTFITSILLLTWTTSKNVASQAEELKQAEVRNENPLAILERREAAISKILGSVGKKGIIFVAIIGVTIVFASDLSVYADQGILIIVPFAIGALVTLFLVSRLVRPQGQEEKVVLDHVITCPNCHEQTALGGTFCEHCGARLVGGTRFEKGVHCKKCGAVNAASSKFCRYCSKPIERGAEN
ncbi:MAG: zinc ribbon domain-containing protein [Promethearchaeota archaeon]